MAVRKCSIDGCSGAVVARGWCSLHYQRWRRHEDPWYVRTVRRTRLKFRAIIPKADYAVVPLSRGYLALIDLEDVEKVGESTWWFCNGYAARRQPNGKFQYMHRFLIGHDQEMTDHINGNTLDNRKANLRPATASENSANSVKPRTSKALYKGVLQLPSGRWRARMRGYGRTGHIGVFDTAEEAARAYDAVLVAKVGNFAKTNF